MENTQTTTPGLDDIRAQLEQLKEANAELLQRLNPKPQEPEHKKMTAEEFGELLQKQPDKAVDLALEGKVAEKMAEVERRFTAAQQKEFYDKKAEQDFPLLTKDGEFQKKVAAKAKELVADGEYTKTSPKLVLRAAQLASMEYKEKNQGSDTSGSSVTEPANVKRKAGSSEQVLKNFDALSDMFGLSKESRERLKTKYKG